MNYDELIKKYKTPFYLYDINTLKNRVAYIKGKLNKDYKLIYAVKANTFIIKEIDPFVDGYEICSYGEYEITSNLGIDNSKCLISGVNKDEESIRNILNSGVRRFTVESINHYHLLEKLTKELDIKIDILIRLTSGNQFGVSEEDFKEVLKLNKDNEFITIKGLEYFTGTQKHSIKKVNREIDYLIEFISMIEEEFNFNIEEVEYGSGSPVFYFRDDEFNEDEYFDELNLALSKIKNKKISIEMGRSIAASCGKYVTSIVDMKSNKYGNTILLDGGINHLVYYGQTMAMRVPYFNLFPTRNTGEKVYNLYGSLCTINDVILKNITLNEPSLGDYFVFDNVGAYSVTEGIALFLSRELPSVIICDINNKYHMVRNHEKTSDINYPNYDVKE